MPASLFDIFVKINDRLILSRWNPNSKFDFVNKYLVFWTKENCPTDLYFVCNEYLSFFAYHLFLIHKLSWTYKSTNSFFHMTFNFPPLRMISVRNWEKVVHIGRLFHTQEFFMDCVFFFTEILKNNWLKLKRVLIRKKLLKYRFRWKKLKRKHRISNWNTLPKKKSSIRCKLLVMIWMQFIEYDRYKNLMNEFENK